MYLCLTGLVSLQVTDDITDLVVIEHVSPGGHRGAFETMSYYMFESLCCLFNDCIGSQVPRTRFQKTSNPVFTGCVGAMTESTVLLEQYGPALLRLCQVDVLWLLFMYPVR